MDDFQRLMESMDIRHKERIRAVLGFRVIGVIGVIGL